MVFITFYMQSQHLALIFLLLVAFLLPVSKQMYFSGAERTVRQSVCASAEQARVRCSVAPGDRQVSATVEDLWGLTAVVGGRWPHKAAPRQKTLAHAAEKRAAPEVNPRHANQVKARPRAGSPRQDSLGMKMYKWSRWIWGQAGIMVFNTCFFADAKMTLTALAMCFNLACVGPPHNWKRSCVSAGLSTISATSPAATHISSSAPSLSSEHRTLETSIQRVVHHDGQQDAADDGPSSAVTTVTRELLQEAAEHVGAALWETLGGEGGAGSPLRGK